MALSDGQSQKDDDDDDGHLRNKFCALWTDSRTEEPESQFKQTMETINSVNEFMNIPIILR